MFKNVASQTLTLYAVDATTGLPKTGDAANMLFYVSKDDGSVTLIAANSGVPSEVDATNAKGLYKIALSQAETNADKLLFSGKSGTANIVVAPAVIYTLPANFSTLSVDSSGLVTLAPAGLDAIVIETGLNARQALSIIAAANGGVLAGAATTTVTIAGAGVATNRITATVDANGNRSVVNLSAPA